MKLNSFLFGFVFLALASTTVLAQVPVASPAPIAAPVAAAPAPAASPAPASVVVAEPSAPPKWAQDVIVAAQNFPVIGPIVSKALLYGGIISSILTALVAFLLTALSALKGISNLSGLASFASKLEAFQSGPVMYYLKYLSMFNAQKPAPATGVIQGLEAVVEEKKAA